MFPMSAFAAGPADGAIDEVTVGGSPAVSAMQPGTNYLWVGDTDSNKVTIVDVATKEVKDTIIFANTDFTYDICFTSTHAYVSHRSNSVSVVELSSLRVVKTLTVAGSSSGFALSPDNKYLYVASLKSNEISVFDTTTNTLHATITLEGGMGDISDAIYDPTNDLVYFTNSKQNASMIMIINARTNRHIDTIVLNSESNAVPTRIDADFANNRLYVATEQGVIYVVDTSQGALIRANVVGRSYGIAKSTEDKLYFADMENEKLRGFDTSGQNEIDEIASVDFDSKTPVGVTLNETRNEVYVSAMGDGKLLILKIAPSIEEDTLTGIEPDTLKLKANILASSLPNDTVEIGYYISTDPTLSPTNLVARRWLFMVAKILSRFFLKKLLVV